MAFASIFPKEGFLKMNRIKRILAMLLVAAMALSLTACSDTSWIVKADGEPVKSGLYIYYQSEGYTEAGYKLAAEDINYYYYIIYGMSYLDATIGDQTVEEYANQYALDMVKQHVVVEKLFDELGLEIPAEEEALLNSQIKNQWSQYGDAMIESGVSKESFSNAIKNNKKEELIFNHYYEVGGVNGTTEDDIKSYLEDNYVRIKYLTFTYAENTEDAVDETKKSEQKALADAYLARANGGEAMDTLIEDYNAYLEELEDDGTKELPNEETAETEEVEDVEEVEAEEEPEEYPNEVIYNIDGTTPSEKFVKYVFENCEVGKYSLVQDDTAFYLVEKLDVLERADIYEENREAFLSALFDADFTSLLNKKADEINFVVNEASVKRYDVKTAVGIDE